MVTSVSPPLSVFDDDEFCKAFKKAAVPFIRGAIEVGAITEHRGSEILISWVAGFASSKLHTIYHPWTQEHTRRVFDLARLVMTSP